MNNRTRPKILMVQHGVMARAKRVWKLPRNPVSDVEKPTQIRSTEIDAFSLEEVMVLVRAADSEQDAATYLTAAFTGLRRGELVALRWRDVDFARRHFAPRATDADLIAEAFAPAVAKAQMPKVEEAAKLKGRRGHPASRARRCELLRLGAKHAVTVPGKRHAVIGSQAIPVTRKESHGLTEKPRLLSFQGGTLPGLESAFHHLCFTPLALTSRSTTSSPSDRWVSSEALVRTRPAGTPGS